MTVTLSTLAARKMVERFMPISEGKMESLMGTLQSSILASLTVSPNLEELTFSWGDI